MVHRLHCRTPARGLETSALQFGTFSGSFGSYGEVGV
jgi:hypothetical protein